MKNLIGIDIGGTKCAVLMGTYNITDEGCNNGDKESLKVFDKISFSTEVNRGPDYTIEKLFDSIDLIIKKNNVSIKEIDSIGISCGGPLDTKRGIILSPPNLIGWNGIHIVEKMKKRFGITVRLQNDANACALAEWKCGAGIGYDNVIFLTFGTGMGAGLILNGRLYSGTNDMAGEIGHIRMENYGPPGYGKAGSFEGFCSGGGIAALAKVKATEIFQLGGKVSFCESISQIDKIDAKIVGDAAENGDPLAKEIYEISGHYLGKGIALIIDVLNPEVIVIGSIFTHSKELLWTSAQNTIYKESLQLSSSVCKVVPSMLGNAIGDFGALVTALYY